jgi:hypothetical protein
MSIGRQRVGRARLASSGAAREGIVPQRFGSSANSFQGVAPSRSSRRRETPVKQSTTNLSSKKCGFRLKTARQLLQISFYTKPKEIIASSFRYSAP